MAGSTVTVATASNFALTAKALEAAFEKSTNFKLRLVFGSSGKMAAQIRHGAPFDLFLSADQDRPIQLINEGLGLEESRFSYAQGSLVMWSNHPDFKSVRLNESFLSKQQGRNLRIAIANPKLAPYGQAAIAVIGNNKAIELIQGENIAQTYQFSRIAQVDAGFIARSQWLHMSEDIAGKPWEVPTDRHPPILQDAVLLKRAQHSDAAWAFWQFLQSAEARKIIEEFGYISADTHISVTAAEKP